MGCEVLLLSAGDDRPQAAITGIGCIAGGRAGVDAVWELLLESGPGRVELPDLDYTELLGRRTADRTSIATRLAVLAAREARTDAGVTGPDPVDADQIGVVLTPITLTNQITAAAIDYAETGARPRAQMAGGFSVGAAAFQVADDLGAAGPCWAVEAGCSSSSVALTDGARLVVEGEAAVAYAGGADCQVNLENPDRPDLMKVVFDAMRIRAEISDARPFDTDRAGMFVAPGAAVLRLETVAAVVERGDRPSAVFLAGATTRGGKDFFSPDDDGTFLQRAIENACRKAGLAPGDIRLAIAHGTGTRANDLAESRAIAATIGEDTPVMSVKGLVGHTTYGAGALNAVVGVQAIRTGVVPPTAGLVERDPEITVDVVAGEPRSWEPGPVACLSLGLGGFNTCTILAPAPD